MEAQRSFEVVYNPEEWVYENPLELFKRPSVRKQPAEYEVEDVMTPGRLFEVVQAMPSPVSNSAAGPVRPEYILYPTIFPVAKQLIYYSGRSRHEEHRVDARIRFSKTRAKAEASFIKSLNSWQYYSEMCVYKNTLERLGTPDYQKIIMTGKCIVRYADILLPEFSKVQPEDIKAKIHEKRKAIFQEQRQKQDDLSL